MYSSTSALTKNIYELQSDVLAEKISQNPYMPYHVLIEKNKQLATAAKTIVGAINELLRKINATSTTNKAALAELYNVLGHVGAHPELTHAVLGQSSSLIELVLSLIDKVDDATGSHNVAFTDKFHTGNSPQDTFQLSHEPNKNTLRCFVNGLQYTNTDSNAFIYNAANHDVTWVFTKDNGGFDLVDAEVIWEYAYDLKKELQALEGSGNA